MGMNLFDESDDTDKISKLEFDPNYALRYEHNKNREELHKLQELKKKGIVEDSDDSETESEDDGDTRAIHPHFFDVLDRVKKRDPVINIKDKKLFESDDEEVDEEGRFNKKPKKEKPMYLKDVVATQAIKHGAEFEEEDDEVIPKGKTYDEEQEEYVDAFLEKANEGEDGDLLIEKSRNDGGSKEDEGNGEMDKFEGLFDTENEEDLFLKNYLMNEMWIARDKGKLPDVDDLDVSEDEEEVEKQEKYEAEYNFRHEEGAGDRILGYSRVTVGTVRNMTNARKQQRKSKEQRIAQAEEVRKEELKHMKNVKRKEIEEKLKKIREIAGISEEEACLLNEDDLEKDFDADEHDRKMKDTFDGGYYDAEDKAPGFGSDDEDDGDLEKPDFDKEDELLGIPKNWDICGPSDGFSAAREKVLKLKAQKGKTEGFSELSDTDEIKEEEQMPVEGKRKRKRKISLVEKLSLDKDLEEYYKLDYEDTIGDLKTRFKYASVEPRKFGLKTEAIISMDDKELNDYVPLKMISPYREQYIVPKHKKNNQKLKNMLAAQGVDPKDNRTGKKHHLKGEERTKSSQTSNVELGEPRGSAVGVDFDDHKIKKHSSKGENLPTSSQKYTDELVEPKSEESKSEKESRRAKRRHRQAELKISKGRLEAYGVIPAQSKSKKKQ
ncbi:hypothetical protein GIB67_027358 [Kingdonia uniflora]|uniref:Kri1-like C-terminal domain-containing protein n=1 Tax=Kingdonia uniflora TaxID=39325 RepID=A0A7J7MF43_9MAGN|nr:hypothetical protein GIB67_027358 [Kingdonia uniflora]